ncbi:hypothetical protein E2C01_030235 [Portunus trituberculatus]|uniref:Uncharacterized protein n=1 Tax=Portunus trituberculatus TaxID=210409 RepID=A0A5B7EU75_PORTR|nr:hypothetical protein [Portunus trituberculatus]
MIPGRNIKCMRLRRWKAQVPFVGNLSIMYSTRTGCIKPRCRRFRLRKRVRNVRLHARHYYLCYAFSTQRWVSDSKTVIRKISIIPPQGLPNGRGKTPEAPLLLGGGIGEIEQDIEMGLWSKEPNSISRRIRGKEKIKSVRRISNEVNEEKSREMSRNFGSPPGKQSDLGTLLDSPPERDSEAGFRVAI